MKTITFKGEAAEDGHAKTTAHGVTFVEGVGQEFEDDHEIVEKLNGHPLFDVTDGGVPKPKGGKGATE